MVKKILLLMAMAGSQLLQAQIHIGKGQTYANIQAAASSIVAGDTVYVHKGSYRGYQGIVGLKGTAAKPIVIIKYKNDTHDINGCWQFQACEYITFKYLNFKANSTASGRMINVDNNGDCATQSKYITFDSCSFSNVTDGASITAFKFGGVDYFQIINCIFKNIPNCDAFDFNVCHHGLIKGNRIENCLTAGHIKGGASDITMERNIFINASSGQWVTFEFGGDTGPQFYCKGDTFEVKDLRFYSNLIIGGARGFALSSARDCKVVNNTFFNCNGATFRLLNTSSLYPKLRNNIVENNIFAFGSNAYMNASQQQAGSTHFSNNIYYSLVNTKFKGPYWDTPEMDSVKEQNLKVYTSDTIMFLDTSNRDLHLVNGSPSIATGKAQTAPTIDAFGYLYKTARCVGGVEYNSVLAAMEVRATKQDFSVYPNPSHTGFITLMGNPSHPNSTIKSLQIFGLTGELIYSTTQQQLPLTITTKTFAKGVYILKVLSDDFVEVRKVVVE
ncbi:MAG: T9SS type A sorting domain-containing protein [Bacteroidetes bacterium]|nr:T9SS type A sorting domain-containing protein [Bacteroidota bacterium]